MRRQTRKQRRNRSLLRYKQKAPCGIGRTKAAIKRDKDAAEALVIVQTYADVMRRDPRCRVGEVVQTACTGGSTMHEDPPRSKTRGLPPEERFNTRVCLHVCSGHHEDVTRHRLRIVKLTEQGFDGKIAVVERPCRT